MASHLTLIAVLMILVVRVLLAELDAAIFEAVRAHGLTVALAIGFAVMAVERTYYVLARGLKRDGIDLYAAHPAPEVLSLMLAFALHLIAAPVVRARSASLVIASRTILIELAIILVFWAGAVWVLY